MSQDNVIKLPQPLGPDLPPILYDGRGAGRRDRPVWRGHPGSGLAAAFVGPLQGQDRRSHQYLWRAFRVLDHGGSVPAPLRPIKHSFTFDLHFQGAFGGLRGFRPVSSAEGFIQRCLQKAMQWISPKFL